WGCLRSAIGKCVLLGYKPWKSVDGTSLEPYHQTCVRLLRADFCGDGMAYTIDGRLLNLYDRLNIQRDTEPWNFEAEWDTDGARCMTDEHRTNGSPIPCFADKNTLGCGLRSHFQTGTLLMSEIPDNF